MTQYSNLPPTATPDTSSKSYYDTSKAVDDYYSTPVELNSTALAAMKGYFENRGFSEVAAESITVIIMRQSYQDGYNPMQVLDTLKGLNNIDLSGIVSEILNYNRFKTSSLGYAQKFIPNEEIQRSIIDNGVVLVNSSYIYILTDENGLRIIDENNDFLTTQDI